MPIVIVCPICRHQGRAPSKAVGQSVRCAKCGAGFVARGAAPPAQVPVRCPGCARTIPLGPHELSTVIRCAKCGTEFVPSGQGAPEADGAEPAEPAPPAYAPPAYAPPEPWYYRAVFWYAWPIKGAALLAAVLWALLPLLVASLPFFIASDVSDAIHDAAREQRRGVPNEMLQPEPPAQPQRVSKASVAVTVTYAVGYGAWVTLDATCLLLAFLLVDCSRACVHAARERRTA